MGAGEETRIRSLKDWRLAKSWSQEQLARRTGLTMNTVARIERGDTRPSAESIAALVSVGVPVEILVGRRKAAV